jgi:hypothetical protein
MLTEAIKALATDPATDPKVKRKTLAVLASWHRQFADDRSMAAVANLYRQVKPAEPPRRPQVDRAALEEEERKRREEEAARRAAKEDAKLKAKHDKERLRAEEEARKRKAKEKPVTVRRPQRKAFNFEEVRAPSCCTVRLAYAALFYHRKGPKYWNPSPRRHLRRITW